MQSARFRAASVTLIVIFFTKSDYQILRYCQRNRMFAVDFSKIGLGMNRDHEKMQNAGPTPYCARSPAGRLRWQQGHPPEKRHKSNLTTAARPTVSENLKPGAYDASAAKNTQTKASTFPMPKRTTRAWLFGQNLRHQRGQSANFFAMPIWPKVRSQKSRQHLHPTVHRSELRNWAGGRARKEETFLCPERFGKVPNGLELGAKVMQRRNGGKRE
jgi:hypothetical protein